MVTTAPTTNPDLPVTFQHHITLKDVLSPQTIDAILGWAKDNFKAARIGSALEDHRDAVVRRSQVCWLPNDGFQHVYQHIAQVVSDANLKWFGFNVTAIQKQMQVARYAAGDRGHYNWHMDAGELQPQRKLSITMQLSDPGDYSGGRLEFFFQDKKVFAPTERGSATIFPSFTMHRVTPVTKGVRYSLVAWIIGPRWM